jgi:hypothetical protein
MLVKAIVTPDTITKRKKQKKQNVPLGNRAAKDATAHCVIHTHVRPPPGGFAKAICRMAKNPRGKAISVQQIDRPI